MTNYVYYGIFTMGGLKLDLSICNESGIDVYTPLKEDTVYNISKIQILIEVEKVDVFNKSAPFFNDICVSYDTDDTVGLPFTNRKDFFIGTSVCSIGCILVKIDFDNKIVQCKCDVSKSIFNNVNDKFKNTILNSNFFVVRCTHLVFNAKRLKDNIGGYTLFAFIVIQLCNFIYFLITSIDPIKIVIFSKMSSPPKKKRKQSYKSYISKDDQIPRRESDKIFLKENQEIKEIDIASGNEILQKYKRNSLQRRSTKMQTEIIQTQKELLHIHHQL